VGDYPTSHHKGKTESREKANAVKGLAHLLNEIAYINKIKALADKPHVEDEVEGRLEQAADGQQRRAAAGLGPARSRRQSNGRGHSAADHGEHEKKP